MPKLRRLLPLIAVPAVLVCTYNTYHPSMRAMYREQHGWGWPIDTIGPYAVTARLWSDALDSSGSDSDRVVINGLLKADCRHDTDKEVDEKTIPKLRISSFCLEMSATESETCLTVDETSATYQPLEANFISGPRMTLEPLIVPVESHPTKYTYRLSLMTPTGDTELQALEFSHDLRRANYQGEIGYSISPIVPPSPFCTPTLIPYYVPDTCFVLCVLYDVQGVIVDTVVNETQPPGFYEAVVERPELRSGLYFYRIDFCGRHDIGKIILLL